MPLVKFVTFYAILLLVLSCEVKIPDNIIPPAKMEEVLYDYHLVQAMSGEYASDSYKEKLYYSYVFEKHNIEKEQFDSAMQWYNRYPKHLKRIYEHLATKLEGEVERLDKIKIINKEGVMLELVSLDKDTADLWTSSKVVQLSSNSLNNRLLFSFDVPEDTTFVKGDSLAFSFAVDFISPDTIMQEAFASIRLDYDDNTLFADTLRIDTSGVFNLTAPRHHDAKLKSMCGFVYYTDNDTALSSRMFLSDISLYRIHQAPQK